MNLSLIQHCHDCGISPALELKSVGPHVVQTCQAKMWPLLTSGRLMMRMHLIRLFWDWWENVWRNEKQCSVSFWTAIKASWLSNSSCGYFLRRYASREKGKGHSAQSWCLSWFSSMWLSTSSFSTTFLSGSKIPIFGEGADLADKDSMGYTHSQAYPNLAVYLTALWSWTWSSLAFNEFIYQGKGSMEAGIHHKMRDGIGNHTAEAPFSSSL